MSNASLSETNDVLGDQRAREPLEIALVNNMPDAALQTTERQFTDLLRAAGGDYQIRLRLFSFPELIRSESGRAYVADHYEPIDALWNGEFDALIVTGAEPRTGTLREEVYWQSLARLVDFAIETSMPGVWSCLAAHAAVLHLDGIERRPVGNKISGVFECVKQSDDALFRGLPSSWRIPHSRHNTLAPAQLLKAGYEILSFSEQAGVDSFTLRRRAQFVFYQGHPEYDAGALLREYRRDVGRFLAGTIDRYPDMPRAYFDVETTRALDAFRARAERRRTRELFDEFPEGVAEGRLAHVWHDVAVQLYSLWLTAVVADRKSSELIVAGGAIPPRSP